MSGWVRWFVQIIAESFEASIEIAFFKASLGNQRKLSCNVEMNQRNAQLGNIKTENLV
jgi:hypothetical protein